MSDLLAWVSLSRDAEFVLRRLPAPNILVIMDDELKDSLIENVLREINAELVIVKSALEAMDVCVENTFSVILHYAEMDSEEALKAAKLMVLSELTRDVPIIFVNPVSELDQLNFSRYKSAPVDYVSRAADPHLIVAKVDVFLALQMQRLVIAHMEKNIDLGRNLEVQIATEIDHGETEPLSRDIIRVPANIISDLISCSGRMDGIIKLSAIVAHDFNNILAIVLGNLELLEYEDIEDLKIQGRLSPIQSAAERACAITNQLSRLYRPLPQKQMISNVNQVLEGIKPLILAELNASVTLTLNLSERVWLVNIETDDFQRTVLELIRNASEAMPAGGQLVIETTNVVLDQDCCDVSSGVDHGEYVELSVTDSGHGISADSKPFVFDPFFSTKVKTGIKGMGLSHVYGFCRRSKGYVWLCSDSDVGTAAHLYLPRTVA
ncbi:MAG: ATP-binding protein [Halioglobus sp.]|nr:ATP-binding protein [Halioglobus sp.]